MKIKLQNFCWFMIISKNNYRLIAIDLSKQKDLYTHPKAVQQTEFVGK